MQANGRSTAIAGTQYDCTHVERIERSSHTSVVRGASNPTVPTMPRRNVYLTAAQLDRLADEAGRYRSLVLLLGVGGLRWGEVAALRVGDVDFLRRRIELHRNAVQVNSRFVVGSLKSNKNRTSCSRRSSWTRWRPHARARAAMT